MLIRIISGTYGHRPVLPNGRLSEYVVPTTRNDPPIDVPEDTAARLVEAGVAEYLHAEEPALAETPAEEEPAAVYTTELTASALRAAMKEHGLTVRSGMTKQEMADALNGAEEPPELYVQDVVEG